MAFGTGESVLFIKVFSIQGCPYRGVPLYHVLCSLPCGEQSAGDLQNDEHTAGIMLQMVKSSNKLLGTLSGDGKGAFHRVSGTYTTIYSL